MHDRIRDAMLGRWARLVTTRPRATVTLCLLLTGAALLLTVLRLEFRSDRSELIDPDLRWNRRYADHKERFDRWDDLVAVLDGPAGDPDVDALARAIAGHLRGTERVQAADAGFDVRDTGPRLFAVAPEPIFSETLAALGAARRIAACDHPVAALDVVLSDLRAGGPPGGPPGANANADADDSDLDRLDAVLTPYLAALEGDAPDFSVFRPDRDRWQPLVDVAGAGRLRFIRIQLARTGGGIDQVSAELEWLRGEIAGVVATSARPDLDWGVTGIPAIEADETRQSMRDSTIASILAFVLITALMVAVFRGWIVPLLAAGSLLVGMTWSFGWLVLSVGHLQLLSVVFSVILLGLGIDFALHLVARLELVRDDHATLPDATERVFRGVGPGMITGAITTAAAFGATALTQFRGVAEMGVIAGGGIILCLVAMLTVFPAALAWTGRWKSIIRHRAGGETAHFAHGRLDVVDFHPKGTLAAALVALVLLALSALAVRYDPNVLNLHPPGIESVEWERRIVEDETLSVWRAIVETTATDAPALADELRALPGVQTVGGMGLLFPPDRVERAARIAAARDEPVTAQVVGGGLDDLRRRLLVVRAGLPDPGTIADADAAARLGALSGRIAQAIEASRTLSDAERTRRETALAAAYAPARRELADLVTAALAPVPPGPGDLPPVLREQWQSGDVWLLEVFPGPDPAGRSILDPDRLGPFVRSLEAAAPAVLGPAVQIFESSELIKREYVKAAVYAIAAILLLLLLDFRSVSDALCAILPVSAGFVGVFGMMGLFGWPLNFANIIVLPLIFGIGVDAGVHMVHRWRVEPWGRPAGLSGGTGRGITLTMCTTMIGFGCMLIAEHRGIRSLGFVMTVGLGTTLLACYVVLPPVLRLRTGHWLHDA